ncbi:CCA tRNA nucleotidyltransferase [Ureibacillus acetophenoni]|uniref:CCA-adding enzyme n=1 Tax=Ureibacillus acetophenoni TaxID=614649 RepID=A0A285U7K3_9BACL|nr:CCA tRNA nucleotidyltransferase [Ureibacillus acetophenoni]SOC37657.1 tRNA nucleotidyltransferase (CCA-adding enzyme) [Ureibacillus acetophenoni]
MMHTKDWDAAIRVIEKIENAGYEAVIVGGAVRDFLLEKDVNDVDVATSAMPEEIKKIFHSTVDVGIAHGTVLVLDEGQPIEVTTYRTEGVYVDFRRPEQVTFVKSLEKDLERRDFTINAMAMTKTGELIDLFGGREDIKNQLIRAVGDPNTRFREDALRMLRAVRFSAQLGFSIEHKTLNAIIQDSDLIEFIAKERIHSELSKMWTSNKVYDGVKTLIESNLATYLEGDFKKYLDDWRYFTTSSSEVGWAYLSLLNRLKLSDIINFYKLSNKEKNFIRNVLNAYQSLLDRWNELDYFQYDIVTLEVAYDFAIWQKVKVPFKKEHIALVKSTLPIQSMAQLAINGNHLKEWTGKKGGPWLKVVLDAALLAVLKKQIKNDEDHLKEWFLHEFNDER